MAKEMQARLGYVSNYCCCRNPVIFLLKGKGGKKIKKLLRPSLNCNLKIRKLQVQCAVLSVTSRPDKVLPKPVSRQISVWCKKKTFLAYTSSYRQAVCLKEPISGLSVSLKIFRAYVISESILARLQLAGGNLFTPELLQFFMMPSCPSVCKYEKEIQEGFWILSQLLKIYKGKCFWHTSLPSYAS